MRCLTLNWSRLGVNHNLWVFYFNVVLCEKFLCCLLIVALLIETWCWDDNGRVDVILYLLGIESLPTVCIGRMGPFERWMGRKDGRRLGMATHRRSAEMGSDPFLAGEGHQTLRWELCPIWAMHMGITPYMMCVPCAGWAETYIPGVSDKPPHSSRLIL